MQNRTLKFAWRELVNNMNRPHTLVELRQVEYRLASMMVALSKRKDHPDYLLDIEFHTQLTALMAEFGYTAPQVVKLLCAREKFSDRGINPLLDLIPGRKVFSSEPSESVERMGVALAQETKPTSEVSASKRTDQGRIECARAREDTYA